MSRKPPTRDIDEQDLEVDPPKHAAAGPTAVAARPAGPVVRVARGNTVTEVPVGGK